MMHGKAVWKSVIGEIAKARGVYSTPYVPPAARGQHVDVCWVKS